LPFNTQQVLQVCERLNDVQKRRILRELNAIDPNEVPELCGVGSALIVWAADLFHVFDFWDSDRIWELIAEFKLDLQSYAMRLWPLVTKPMREPVQDRVPIGIFAVADRRYVTMSGRSNFLDMQTLRRIDGLPRNFLELLHYNLATLFLMRVKAINALPAKDRPGG